jgi:hypothetical protein
MSRSLVCGDAWSSGSRRISVRQWCVIVVAAGAALACSDRREAPKVPLTKSVADPNAVEAAHGLIGPAAKAALDSGNVLFRHKAYAAALAQYRAASALAPQHSAPLFGIYMVARATNNPAMADSALAGIRLRGGAMTPAPHVLTDTALRRIHENLPRKPSAG